MSVDIFNNRYALPSLLQVFSLTLAWIQAHSTKFKQISASSSPCYQTRTLTTALIIFCIFEQSPFWSLHLIIAHRFFNYDEKFKAILSVFCENK